MTDQQTDAPKKTPDEIMREERESLAFNMFGIQHFGRRFQRIDAFAAALLETEADRLVSLCFKHGDPDQGMMTCPCDAADDLRAQADAYRRGAIMGDHDSNRRV